MDDGLVIETREFGKRYDGRIVAVDRLKATTLRILLGLVRPTAGGALVLGAPPGSPESLARVGAPKARDASGRPVHLGPFTVRPLLQAGSHQPPTPSPTPAARIDSRVG